MEEPNNTSDENEESRDTGAGAEGAPMFAPKKFRGDLRLSVWLVSIFAIVYFSSAMLASAPFKDIAAVVVMGIPLALWVGWITLIAGVVIVRIYLKNMQTQTGRVG